MTAISPCSACASRSCVDAPASLASVAERGRPLSDWRPDMVALAERLRGGASSAMAPSPTTRETSGAAVRIDDSFLCSAERWRLATLPGRFEPDELRSRLPDEAVRWSDGDDEPSSSDLGTGGGPPP